VVGKQVIQDPIRPHGNALSPSEVVLGDNFSAHLVVRVHDQNVAADYFSAMSRVERRLEIVPRNEEESERQVLGWIEKLTLPELDYEERLEIAEGLRQALISRTVDQILAADTHGAIQSPISAVSLHNSPSP
jgi:hypothetical protein